jgi:hypothetical protein
VVAVLLLPSCAGAASALVRVVRASGSADVVWVATLAGALCWWTIYLLLPKPMWIYVFGHELTHALWAWLFGGRVKKFKASAKGGHVVITKSNFLIILAPYFFPIYVVLVVLLFALGHVVLGWTRYFVWFHLVVGAAYGFHLTLTWHILQTRQTDISSQGWFFSGVIIFLGNILVLLLGVPMLTARVSVLTALSWWMHETANVFQRLGNVL